MTYVYLVKTKHYTGSSHNESLLGAHSSHKSASEHFKVIMDDRIKRQSFDHIPWHNYYPAEPAYDVCWIDHKMEAAMVIYKGGPGIYEEIELIKVKVCKPKKGRRKRGKRS